VLTSFQQKIDGPSSLLLKSLLYAYTLKDGPKAQACFRELVTTYPTMINGYIEYWQYLSLAYKAERNEARQLL